MGDRLGTLDAVGFSFLSFLLLSLHSFDPFSPAFTCLKSQNVKNVLKRFCTSSRPTLDGVFIYHYKEIELLYRFCYLRNKFFCIIFNQNAFVYFAYCFVYKFDIMICFKHLFTWGPTSSFVKKTNRPISLNTFLHQHICYNAFQKEN